MLRNQGTESAEIDPILEPESTLDRMSGDIRQTTEILCAIRVRLSGLEVALTGPMGEEEKGNEYTAQPGRLGQLNDAISDQRGVAEDISNFLHRIENAL